jgi:hypothetical protein
MFYDRGWYILKVQLHDETVKQKAMMAVSGLQGIEFLPDCNSAITPLVVSDIIYASR